MQRHLRAAGCTNHVAARRALWQDHLSSRRTSRSQVGRRFLSYIYPWEYMLCDKGCDHILTEYKKPVNRRGQPRQDLTLEQKRYGLLVQHYRARGEHLIRQMRGGKKALTERWSGSFSLLSAITRIAAHMTGLQERMMGPRYDVYGPWPVCSEQMFRQYPMGMR